MEQVRYEVDGAVARITIDRPERHNAMSFQVMQELGESIELAKTDDSVRSIGTVCRSQVNPPSFV